MFTETNSTDTPPPTLEQLEEWASDSVCEARCVEICKVEHDGYCAHGQPSWFLYLGLI